MLFPTLLRALCLCYAGFLIVSSLPLALLAAATPQGEPFTPAWQIILFVIGAATLLASGFLYVGLLGERMRSAVRHRAAAGVLLALPIAAGAVLLLTKGHPEMRPTGWFFLAPAALAFLCMVWPSLDWPRRAP
jgi:hypothetical protein